jgi:hypothetical protein
MLFQFHRLCLTDQQRHAVYNYLTAKTAEKSKREVYYQHSRFIAEYYCTLSNIGLFAVGIYYRDEATLFAASFSALSHAIPSQRLHDLDMLGVIAIGAKVCLNYRVLLEHPETAVWGAMALAINFLDTNVTRSHLDTVGPWIHVLWHFVAALALYKFNDAQNENMVARPSPGM